jgi:hypothetical protein
MTRSPMDELLDRVDWKPVHTEPQQPGNDLPYVTRAGELLIGHMRLRCYRLNTGMAVIDAGDMERFFGFLEGDGN